MRSQLRSPFEDDAIPTRRPQTHVTQMPSEYLRETRSDSNKEYTINNWHINSNKTPILAQKRIDEFVDDLKVYALPEMLFDSKLLFENQETGFMLQFHALDGLKGARNDVLKEGKVDNIKVGCAWDKTNANVTTSFQTTEGDEKTIEERDDLIDWTFTTLYKGTLRFNDDSQVRIIPNCENQIDYERLKSRDPILFYDELILYEDELHDHGISQLSVKTRVMREYMYILLRFFLRVDGVIVRILDTRFYHEFSRNFIVREFSFLESTYDELTRKNPFVVKDPKIMADPNQLLPMLNTKSKQMDRIEITK